MWQQIVPAFRMMLVLTVLTGMIYPAIVTGLCNLAFPNQAGGSLAVVNGRTIGSFLIGQSFRKPEYFHPRPSAAGSDGYDASSSAASNYGTTNKKLIDRVKASVAEFRKENPSYTVPIPADAVSASGRGLDPDISPAYAYLQVPRVARENHLSAQQVRHLVDHQLHGRALGVLGEPTVNVLDLNLALHHATQH